MLLVSQGGGQDEGRGKGVPRWISPPVRPLLLAVILLAEEIGLDEG